MKNFLSIKLDNVSKGFEGKIIGRLARRPVSFIQYPTEAS